MTRYARHDDLGRVLGRLSHVRVTITEQSQHEGNNLDNVGLKDLAERSRKRLECEKGTLARLIRSLVFCRVAQLVHELVLFERLQTAALDDTGKTVSGTSSGGVLGAGCQGRKELVDQVLDFLAHVLYQGRQTIGNGRLDQLGRRVEGFDKSIDDFRDPFVVRVQMSSQSAKQLNCQSGICHRYPMGHTMTTASLM